jgi:hypothetical protein
VNVHGRECSAFALQSATLLRQSTGMKILPNLFAAPRVSSAEMNGRAAAAIKVADA